MRVPWNWPKPEPMTAHHPDDECWPAAWHRAVMGRAAERIPGLRLRFFTDAEPAEAWSPAARRAGIRHDMQRLPQFVTH